MEIEERRVSVAASVVTSHSCRDSQPRNIANEVSSPYQIASTNLTRNRIWGMT